MRQVMEYAGYYANPVDTTILAYDVFSPTTTVDQFLLGNTGYGTGGGSGYIPATYTYVAPPPPPIVPETPIYAYDPHVYATDVSNPLPVFDAPLLRPTFVDDKLLVKLHQLVLSWNIYLNLLNTHILQCM
jgi:hypothetical protein